MANKYSLVEQFKGYVNKVDQTKLGPGYLVSGSQDVVSTDGETIAQRQGYTLDGAANTALTPITWSTEWLTKRGLEVPLRAYDDELEYRYSGAWYRLADSWTALPKDAAEYWDTTEGQDALLIVNGDDNIYYWSGGITTFASATSNTITKQGTTTWAQEGFLTAGTRQVIIGGTTYTYTGGETTTTLTGVTPDPTSAGHSVGAVVHQALRTTSNKPAADVENDIIEVLDNQVYVASENDRQIYKSAVNDYTDYTFSSPRLVGEGGLITLDGTPTAMIPQEDVMYVSTTSQWFSIVFSLSSDLQNESIQVKRLKTNVKGGANNKYSVNHLKNVIAFVSNEPTLDQLGRVEDFNTPTTKPLSDPIKTDFNGYDFTNAHVIFFQNNVYIALPVESKVLIYNLEKGYWEAPHNLPVRRLAVIGNALYGHSNAVPETYKLYTGYNDNTNPIQAKAKFSYMNYGQRFNKKKLDEWVTEGYINSNTTLTCTLDFNYKGYTGSLSHDIAGDNEQFLEQNINYGGLGKYSLGKLPLGGSEAADELAKFRHIKKRQPKYFFELQPTYESYGVDYRWELLCFGGNTQAGSPGNNEVTE